MRSTPATLILVVALAGCGRNAGPETIDEQTLLGTWVASLEHNGQESEIVLRFERDEDGTLRATAAVPAIAAPSMPVGPAEVLDDGTAVRVGPWTFAWNPRAGRLEAERLDGMIPVHAIPVALERRAAPEARETDLSGVPSRAPAWTLDTGAPSWSGVTVADGSVYVGNDAGEVLAVDAADGTVRWRISTGGAVRARPTVHGDALLVHSDDGRLYAFDRRRAVERWRSTLRDEPFERVPPGRQGSRYDHFASAATVVGDTVYVGSADGRMHALVAGTGESRWTYAATDTISSTPAVADDRVAFGSFDGKVRALAAGDGTLVWEFDTGAAVPSSPALAKGLVVIGSRSYDLWALDAASGEPVWKYYYWFSWVDSDANVVDDTVFVGSSDARRVFALDLATGRPRWSFDAGGWAWARPAVTASRVFAATLGVTDYIGPRSGGLFALDRSTGAPLWQFAAPPVDRGMWGFAGAPAVDADRVFAAGIDGRLHAFDPR